ncbi:MAG: metallophosphoesterase family protein [Alphaproteobacteria bacterium]|nr:metallophosphoesterase family protein [Alphaproteobacteria bacterium]
MPALRIGLISDTHDLLRPEAAAALRGVDRIVHAGDICGPAVLAGLGAIAPVSAVRGNNDRGAWAAGLASLERIELGGARLLVVHDLADLDVEASTPGPGVVVSGHSHRPSIATRGGVLYVNPGSAGPRRFALPVALAELTIEAGAVSARIIELAAGGHRG